MLKKITIDKNLFKKYLPVTGLLWSIPLQTSRITLRTLASLSALDNLHDCVDGTVVSYIKTHKKKKVKVNEK